MSSVVCRLSSVVCGLLIAMSAMCAQDVDSLRADAEKLSVSADSLYKGWERMWKVSDSLRIESIFLRMRSDSLKRQVAALKARAKRVEDSIAVAEAENLEENEAENLEENGAENLEENGAENLQENEAENAAENAERMGGHAAAAAAAVRKPTVKKGATYSDSVTADIIAIEADTGVASYYAEKFHGKPTSSGEKYNMHDLTCAHRWLPYGTKLRVINLANQREVIVRVNDRGPFHHSRMIDVSKQAAKELDMIRSGTTRVSIQLAD
jgi:rare lipoprotein A